LRALRERRRAAPTATANAAPSIQKGAFVGRTGDAAHEVDVFVVVVPVHVSPVHEADPVAVMEIFAVSTAFSAVTHPVTSLVFT